jgi:homoserine O-acetyltransferase/O-succinyltransferase
MGAGEGEKLMPGLQKKLMMALGCCALILFVATGSPQAATFPQDASGNYFIKNFHFASGETLPEVRIHYQTFGEPRRDREGVVRNAVLILHATASEGGYLLTNVQFAEELFGKGQPLDATRYYIIIPDNIGHGGSSKPSDGLRARFPHYGYRDMVETQYRLVTDGLKINHLRLVLGTSMGGMHTWLWGEKYPDFMDALLPMASLPIQISGRNRMWRKMVSDMIRNDPEWRGGDYVKQPPSLKYVNEIFFFMLGNPVQRQNQGATLKQADAFFRQQIEAMLAKKDANDILYSVESSYDYDPGPDLEKIKAPLLAINFADDLINPPELGILEREIKRVKNGRALLVPPSVETVGHGTYTKPSVWKHHLERFLLETEP